MSRPIFLVAGVAVMLSAVSPAGADAPACRYTVAVASGTVFDAKTGLTWQRGDSSGGDASTGMYTWALAVNYCTTLASAGTWRLPTAKELATIVDVTKSPGGAALVDLAAFPAAHADGYWSTTPDVGSPDFAWYVRFTDGIVNFGDKSSLAFARCVMR